MKRSEKRKETRAEKKARKASEKAAKKAPASSSSRAPKLSTPPLPSGSPPIRSDVTISQEKNVRTQDSGIGESALAQADHATINDTKDFDNRAAGKEFAATDLSDAGRVVPNLDIRVGEVSEVSQPSENISEWRHSSEDVIPSSSVYTFGGMDKILSIGPDIVDADVLRYMVTDDPHLWKGMRIMVPIDVQALAIEESGHDCHVSWSDVVSVEDGWNDSQPLQPGVHLHWKIPDGLNHAMITDEDERLEDDHELGIEYQNPEQTDVDLTELDLPQLPDRWIVIRTSESGTVSRALNTAAWVIESRTQKVTPLDEWTPSHDAPPEADPENTAIGPGLLHWAGTYQTSKGHCTFHDKLDVDQLCGFTAQAKRKVKSSQREAASGKQFPDGSKRGVNGPLNYIVIGWYANKELDPLWLDSTPTEEEWFARMDELGWKIDVEGLRKRIAELSPILFFPTKSVSPVVRYMQKSSSDDEGKKRSKDKGKGGIEKTQNRQMDIGDGSQFRNLDSDRYEITKSSSDIIHSSKFAVLDLLFKGTPLSPLWPRQSLYHGSTIGVRWREKGGKHDIQDLTPDAGETAIAIGYNAGEALAALVANEFKDITDRENYEEYIAGFNLGILSQLTNSAGYYGFRQQLHKQTFDSRSGGYYVIEDHSEGSDERNDGDIIVRPSSNTESEPTPSRYSKMARDDSFLNITKSEVRHDFSRDIPDMRDLITPTQSDYRAWTKKRKTADEEVRYVKIPAPKFYAPHDPLVLLTTPMRNTRDGGDGRFNDDDSLSCRFSGQYVEHVGCADPPSISASLTAHAGIPIEITDLLNEMVLMDPCNYTIEGLDNVFEEYYLKGVPLSGDLAKQFCGICKNPSDHGYYYFFHRHPTSMYVGVSPSPVGVNGWSQAWLPIFADFKLQFDLDASIHLDDSTDDEDESSAAWSHGEIDFHPSPPPATLNHEDTRTIEGRALLSTGAASIISHQLRDLLKLEDEYDASEERDGNFDGDWEKEEGDEGVLELLAIAYEQMDLLNFTLAKLCKRFQQEFVDKPLMAGSVRILKIALVDAFGQTLVIRTAESEGGIKDVTPAVSISMEKTPVATEILLKPRIPHPSRLSFRLLRADDDTREATLTPLEDDDTNHSSVCCFLLPDHVEAAMEVFDNVGSPCGQLRYAEPVWEKYDPITAESEWEDALVRTVQWGRLAWDTPPGTPQAAGALPDVNENQHANSFLNKLMKIGLEEEMLQEVDEEGRPLEGAFSSFMRAIDTTFWAIDPFGGSGPAYPSLLMGRPVAVARAELRLEMDGEICDQLKKKVFWVRLGCLSKITDGLLGYFVNDDYSHFNAVYPTEYDEDSKKNKPMAPKYYGEGLPFSDDQDYLVFDPVIELRLNQTVKLTLLMQPQSSVHATTCFIPQKEITIPSSHYDSALSRLAPTFSVGPVLIDLNEVKLPTPLIENTLWSWNYKPATNVWEETAISPSDDSADILTYKPTVNEGWLKYNRVEE